VRAPSQLRECAKTAEKEQAFCVDSANRTTTALLEAVRNQGSASETGRSSRRRRPRSTDPSPVHRDGERRRLRTATPERPRLDLDALAGRSLDPSICPFLRVEGTGGSLIAPVESPYGGNRCAAMATSCAVGDAQQELLCLSGSFATCPRYARGVARLARPRRRARTRRTPLAVRLASIVLGVVAASAAGHTLAGTAEQPVDEAARTGRGTIAGAAEGDPAGAAALVGTAGFHDRLEPCPDAADCYLWLVKDGDTLPRIAAMLDQPITVLLALNPEVVASGELRVGDRLRVPPPGA